MRLRLVTILVAITAVAALLAGSQAPPRASAQAPVVLKIQASWPASLTLFDHLKFVAERVDKLSGGTLKVEALPAGTIVPAFEVLDATSKKVIDGAHTVAYYWVGKNKTGVLFTGGPGGNYGMDFVDVFGWMYEGGGLELYQQWYKDVLKLNVVPLPAFPSGPQALGWFKRPIKNLADFKGMKCRQTGINAEVYTEMGMRTVNLPGGEILPAAERGVIDCAEWVGGIEDLRLLPQRVEVPLHAEHARAGDDGRDPHQQRRVGQAVGAAQGDRQVLDDRGLHPLVREMAAAER
jgi:TRAP-type mannitol/chloroaromatic compound transport system substrate-binding protein